MSTQPGSYEPLSDSRSQMRSEDILGASQPFVSIAAFVAQQSARNPSALAVTAGRSALTYAELEARANALASRLRSVGVVAEAVVALYLERSLEFVVGALAVLKAGGCYLPLDHSSPAERLAFMLVDARAAVLISDGTPEDGLLPSSDIEHMNVRDGSMRAENARVSPAEIGPDNLAYLIYTSGSTGQPKGVQITHSGLMNLVAWHREAFAITPTDRASQMASVGFDAAVWEIWPYLAAGASIHFAPDATRTSPEQLRDWLVANGITIGFVPTPLAEQMMCLPWPETTALRALLTGGDTLHHRPPRGLPFAFVNNYGPTETTVVATSGRVLPLNGVTSAPTIGRPIANTQVHIAGEDLRPVAPGELGELYIGGAGVARGYVNHPDLTAARFIPDPFTARAGARLYRTGDLARQLPNGEIEFCGRIDDQIKLRGFRIEPNEIIAALARHPMVQASAVKLRTDTVGEKQLAAYVLLADGAPISDTALRDFLRTHLPEYMIPSMFIRMAALPLTTNGKVDRDALPEPTPENLLRHEFVEAQTEVERRLLQILRRLLGINEISLNDNFFLLGGHSLLGAQLIAKVRETFGVELTLMNLFEKPTVSAMAAEIERLSVRRAA